MDRLFIFVYQYFFLQPHSRAHIALLFTNLFFTANYSLVKYISPEYIGPYGLNVIRVGTSLILFWIVWVFGKTSAVIKKQHLGRFIFCGLTGIAINQMLFVKGLTLTSTIHASLLMLCTPLLITLFAFWILKEKVTVLKALGLALGIGGAAILVMAKSNGNDGGSSLEGDLLIILNAISYTIFFILVKPLMKVYTPLHVIRWVFTFGFLMVLPFGWSQFSAITWSAMEITHLLALIFIVLCGTFLAYLFNAYGLRVLGAAIAGSYIYMQPVFAAVIAILLLGEEFTITKLLAGLMICAGVFMVSRKTTLADS